MEPLGPEQGPEPVFMEPATQKGKNEQRQASKQQKLKQIKYLGNTKLKTFSFQANKAIGEATQLKRTSV